MPASEIRLLLVDDHPVVREGLRRLIDAQPGMTVAGEAGDGRTALTKADEIQPDIIVMDVSMPELDGVEATRRLTQRRPERKVLALTVHEDKGYARELLEGGASGYVVKRTADEELVQAIRVVAAGGVYVDPLVAGKVLSAVGRRGATGTASAELSERETMVVRLLAEGYGNKEIAARMKISVRTVETYKARSMEKLGLQTRAELVRFARRKGWLSP